MSPAAPPTFLRVLRPALGAAVCALVLGASAACTKDKPKLDEAPTSEPTPVPSGLVFNDFLPASGNGAGLGVRDAGAEALAELGAGEAPEAAPPPSADKIELIDAGAEPRVARKYAFSPNRVDERVLTITQSQDDGHSPAREMTIKLTLDIAAKEVKPSGATFEAKVTKLDLPGAPPQAAQMLSAMHGLAGTFDVTPYGDVGEVSFVGTAQMQNQLAESVVQAMSQAVQLLFAPLPRAPIGVGAKWEAKEGGEPSGQAEEGVKRFTLKTVTGEGAAVDADIGIKVPRRAAKGPGGVPLTVEVGGKGHYLYELRFDRPATKATGELSITENIEVTDPRSGAKQSVSRVQKGKYLVELAK